MDETMKFGLLLGEHVRRRSGGRFYGHAQNLTRGLLEAYDKALGNYDVIVMPTLPFPATKLPRKNSTLTGSCNNNKTVAIPCDSSQRNILLIYMTSTYKYIITYKLYYRRENPPV